MRALRLNLIVGLLMLGAFAAFLGIGRAYWGPTPWSTQLTRMETLINQAKPLIDAIERYINDNSTPPPTLAALVPKYLPSIPPTGLESPLEFSYRVGKQSELDFLGNPWVVMAYTSRGILNFDMILYFPNKNYPTTAYGGSLERIGDWAYVHE